MIVSVLYWFRTLTHIMTSDKLLYLFGSVSPKLALILSMTLRYIPLFRSQIRKTQQAQKALGLYKEDSIPDNIRGGIRIFSVMVSWALENGVITADSMTARGYGLIVNGEVNERFYVQKATLAEGLQAAASVSRRLLPVLLALIAMLGLSRIMVHGGMIDALALAAADAAGRSWPLFAPLIGILGSFVTGSATASNILFGGFQVATAQQLGFSVLGMMATQGYGATIGNIISPHNIFAASTTVQLVGREGEVMRQTAGFAVAYAVLGGLLAWLVFA